MICLIKQPAGLGDIFFTQKILKTFKRQGYEVVWPVNENFLWLNDYIDHKFVSEEEDFPFKHLYNEIQVIDNEEVLYVPLQYADRHYPREKIMVAKYVMTNLDYSDWDSYFTFTRNTEKEDDLYYNKLGLTDGEEYCLISRNYGSPPNFKKFPINYDGNLKIVELDFYKGFNT